MRRNRQEESKVKEPKSKSVFRSKRPPLPANSKQTTADTQAPSRANRNKQQVSAYNTDTETQRRQSKIPRLSQASVDRIPDPKKYIPEPEYKPTQPYTQNHGPKTQKSGQKASISSSNLENPLPKSEKKTLMKRSQSFLQSKITPNSALKANSDIKDMTNRRSIQYKPYTLREYKQKVDGEKLFGRGGLGANIGGDEWMKEHEKRERIKQVGVEGYFVVCESG